MLYHVISKDLYIQHIKDGWTDRRIRARYGMSVDELDEWVNKNFSKEELEELKNNEPFSFEELYKQALTEIEMLRKENLRLANRLNLPSEENLKLSQKIIEQDYTIENQKHRIQELTSFSKKLQKENKLMRRLLKLCL